MKHQTTIRSVVTGFAMALAVATATAQPAKDTTGTSSSPRQSMPGDDCGSQQRMQSGRHMSGDGYAKHGAHRMSGQTQGGMAIMGNFPASLIEQLSLNDKQKAALVDAQTAAQTMWESSRQMRDAHREAMRKTAAQDTFDPRAMFEQQNKIRESMQASRDAVQKKWLSFWDGLSKEQQSKVSDFMKQNMSRHGNRGMGPRAG